jgi:hypothetical protein
VSVVIEEGKYAAETEASATHVYEAAASPFVLPPGVVPDFRGADACFRSDVAFTVRVQTLDGTDVGAEAWNTCGRLAFLADGCGTWPGGGELTALNRIPGPNGEERVCIMWPDTQSNETGFRITLSYPNSGERFVYAAPPNTVEFFPPAADTAGMGAFVPARNRKDWSLEVVALTPEGERYVGGHSVIVG